ncbi:MULTISPECIES: inorganic phosphate transporter [Streptomyces]|uniref:Phosphate transporter n=1 Tax=Streptomyces rhizosphaericola TaxID=2564098 RepID=A0ABY2PBE6_9ACTN|nr:MULTISPECIES: inorganic phosphate transporter [Streptomyces]ARI55199.1 phosphate transporter [Streptomyces sp. S8]MYU01822.1 inorganic phosphate transporter [Streptomyces sp. SID8350]NGO83396.1 inorganic phosphate transporter [Streptomyces sp. 196(2019)]TGZ07398.1 inorganic phosphate transporter [Streptomyces rhizosphaericola]SCK38770.1 inorganic phosphate transporter, PiT family [Streptomyces sp. AmelKG-D3]
MEHITLLLAIVVVTALVFDFTNGFHDTANAMATTISTGAMKPKTAVAMSAVLNLIGAFLSVEVAKTISGGIVNEDGIRTEVIFAALVGAILWNLFTWLLGLPSSSSHALFGGLIGAAVMSAGWSSINGGTVVTKVLLPAIAAPLVAGIAAMLATRLTYRINRNVTDPNQQKSTAKGYRAGQIASAGLVSLAHGTNDAQKTMGIITLALVTSGVLAPGSNPPMWVIVSAGIAIALGTYLGGWRIIRTMGKGLTDLQPPQGFAAQTSAATVILASSHLGFSLSTTQSCSGAVMGAGLGRKGGVVRWSTATRMFVAWGLTLPAAALVGAGAEFLTKQGPWGIAVTAVILVGGSFAIWLASRREPVDHTNVNDTDDTTADEPQGVVTTAMAAVAPPPTAGAVSELSTTIPAPAGAPDDTPRPAATV